MTLKYRQEQTFHIDYWRDLNDFVKAETGQEWDFAAAEEMANDTCKAFNVTGLLSIIDQGDIQEFIAKKGSGNWMTATLLNWLCLSNRIPKGTYIVHVSW